jgi:hypothetical protein
VVPASKADLYKNWRRVSGGLSKISAMLEHPFCYESP